MSWRSTGLAGGHVVVRFQPAARECEMGRDPVVRGPRGAALLVAKSVRFLYSAVAPDGEVLRFG